MLMSTMMPQKEAPERTSTATKSQEEELQQIEADLQEEKLHSLRSRLDAMLGSLVMQQQTVSTPTGMSVASTPSTNSTILQKPPPVDHALLPGRIWVTDPCKFNLMLMTMMIF